MTTMGATLPTVRYVAPGQVVAFDGEQVTTNLLRVVAGRPGADDAEQSSAGFTIMYAEILFVIVRDTPTIQDGNMGNVLPPSPVALNTNAQLMMQDAAFLTQAMIDMVTIDKVFRNHGFPVNIGPVTTVGPEGGVTAVSGELALPLM
jgi:hypothetical protein